MSYMFELFDIVQGARGRKDSKSGLDHSTDLNQSNNNNNQDQEDNHGESQTGTSPDDHDSELVGHDTDNNNNHSKSSLNKSSIPTLNLSTTRTKSNAGIRPSSPRSNSPRSNSPRSLNNSTTINNSNNNLSHASINISTASVPNFQDSTNTTHLINSNSNDIESNDNQTSNGDNGNDGADNIANNNNNNTTPDGDDNSKTPNGEEDDFKNFKIFVKPKGVFKLQFLKESFKYHWDLFIIGIFITIVSCAYITFYISFGSRYTFVENKDDWPTWGKAASIVTGVINEQFLVSLGYCILRTQFGHKQTKVALPLAACFSIASILLTVFGRIYNLDGTVNYIPKYMLALGNVIFVSLLIGIKTFKRAMFAFWFTLPILVMVLVLVIYDFFLLKWYIRSESEISKSIVRIIVHPIITAICLLVSRVSASQMMPHKPRSTLAFILLPLCFNTFYGRFFGTTMNTLVGVAISGLLISLVDMIWKCSLRARDSIIVKYLCRCSKDASFYMQHNLPLYAEYQSHELIYEIAANFVATFLVVTYFYVFGGEDGITHIGFQFKIMAMQLSFTFVTEFIVSYVSLSYLKLPIIIPWSKRPDGFLFVTTFCWLGGIAYSTIRIINLLNGNWIV